MNDELLIIIDKLSCDLQKLLNADLQIEVQEKDDIVINTGTIKASDIKSPPCV